MDAKLTAQYRRPLQHPHDAQTSARLFRLDGRTANGAGSAVIHHRQQGVAGRGLETYLHGRGVGMAPHVVQRLLHDSIELQGRHLVELGRPVLGNLQIDLSRHQAPEA